MSKFYTNIFTYGNKVYVRGYDEGEQFELIEEFYPTLYVPSQEPTNLKTIHGKYVKEIFPGTIKETKDFLQKYEDVSGFDIFGHTDFAGQYAVKEFPGEIQYDTSKIRRFTIDIETSTEGGFPNVQTASEQILLISIKDSNTDKIHVFSIKDFEVKATNVVKHYSQSEDNMLREFVGWWSTHYPDIVTGWNTDFFDIPYIVNRIERVLGSQFTKKLSPFGIVQPKNIKNSFGKETPSYVIKGISSLDYLRLYQKFTFTKQESYTLDFIASVEIGENKLENPGETFKDFYTNYWQTFVEYNIHDVALVDRLEEKLGLLNLAYSLAYISKINPDQVYGPVKMWEAIIYEYLISHGVVTPIGNFGVAKTEKFEGAFVKEPIAGYHKWVASFDLNSLYPMLMIMYNMSPDTLSSTRLDCNVDAVLNKSADFSYAYENDLAVASNGWCYSRGEMGFFAALMDKYYNMRKTAKELMLKYKSEKQELISNGVPSDSSDILELSRKISNYFVLQLALKTAINSVYGAAGNSSFKYFDLRIAEGITMSGQTSIRWIANAINQKMNSINKTSGVDYIIAIDTDSVYVKLEEMIEGNFPDKSTEEKIDIMDKFCSTVLEPFIAKKYEELAKYVNANKQSMVMKREVLADVGIFPGTKKRYILNVHNSEGVKYDPPDLKIMGMEMVKSSTPALVRKQLKAAVPIIIKKDKAKFHEFIERTRTEFNSAQVEDIAFPRSANNLTTYRGNPIYAKGCPIQVRAALLYNHFVKQKHLDNKYHLVSDSDKIKYVYVRKPNPIFEDVIGFKDKLPKELELHDFVDYEKQFKKVFLDPLQPIVACIGWTVEEQSSLEDFFG